MSTANIRTIIISITVIAVAIIIYLLVKPNNSHPRMDEQEAVSCGSRTIYRYKYPSEFYPSFAQEYNTEVSFTSDLLKRFSDSLGTGQIGVDARNKIIELQQQLNQDNITFSTALRTYFINSNSDPCNDTLRQKFLAFTDEMARRVLDLKNTTSEVTQIEKSSSSASTDSLTPSVGSHTDSSAQKLPNYTIVKDTARIKVSIRKLDEILKTNNKFNSKVKLRP